MVTSRKGGAEALQQAERKVQEIIGEAEQKADEILEAARKKADQLLKKPKDKGVQDEVRLPAVSRGAYVLSTEKSDSVVLHCSDPRFQDAFRRFVDEELELKAYHSLVIPGASQLLMFSSSLPKFSTALLRPLKFVIKENSLKRIFVIMHEDCVWYHRFVPNFFSIVGSVRDQQIRDMVATKRLLQEEFPGVEARLFYASVTPEQKVEFSEILEKS